MTALQAYLRGYESIPGGEFMGSLMHLIVLPIHEAGYLLFIPFGRFMIVLGGSLLQVLLPLVLMASFMFGFGGSRRDHFATSLMLWWAAVSIIDVAPYIWDAFDPKMMLLGGETGAESDGHDWQNVLGDLGLVRRAHLIVRIAHKLGLGVMVVACAWGAALLYLQFRNRESNAIEEESEVRLFGKANFGLGNRRSMPAFDCGFNRWMQQIG